MLIYFLLVLGFFTNGITTLVGLILAYIFAGDAAAEEKTHYTYQIRGFWIFLLYAVILSVISLILALILLGPAWFEFTQLTETWDNRGPGQHHWSGSDRMWFVREYIGIGNFVGVFFSFLLLPLFAVGRFIKGTRLLIKKQSIPNPKTWLI